MLCCSVVCRTSRSILFQTPINTFMRPKHHGSSQPFLQLVNLEERILKSSLQALKIVLLQHSLTQTIHTRKQVRSWHTHWIETNHMATQDPSQNQPAEAGLPPASLSPPPNAPPTAETVITSLDDPSCCSNCNGRRPYDAEYKCCSKYFCGNCWHALGPPKRKD